MKMTCAGFIGAAIILWTGAAVAAESCTQVRIARTEFRPAEFSAPIIWKAAAGERTIENFSDAVLLDDQSIIAGGYYAPSDTPEKAQPYLTRMERRGKIMWQVRGESESVQKIIRIVREGETVTTLSTTQGEKDAPRRIDVSQYDLNGKRTGGFSIGEGDGNLDPAAIVADKNGYYIAARYSNRKVAGQQFGVVYRTDKAGKRLWRRAYIPGLTTTLDDLVVLKNTDLLMAGSMTDRNGRQTGWMVRTDSAGGIKWQKNYGRGRAAQITAISEAKDGSGYVASGVSWPINGERTGSWILKVDNAGDMQWERFFSGPDDYRALDVSTLDDGRSVVMISAMPLGLVTDGQYPHVRVLAMSTRGELLEADSFTDGNGLWASRLLNAGTQPLLIGSIREIPPEPALGKDKKPLPPPPVSYDGWVSELQTFSLYEDPCVSHE